MESYSLTLDEPVSFLRYPDQPPPTGYEQAAYRQHVKIQPTKISLPHNTASLHCGASVSAAYCPGERG